MLSKFKRGRVWYVRGTVRGIRVYETAGTADAARAEEYRARREAQLWDRTVKGERGAHSFGEAALAYLQSRRPSPSSLAKMRPIVEHFQHRQLDQVTQDTIDGYLRVLHARSAPATITRVVITPVVAVLRFAAKRGWCDLPAFDRPKVPPRAAVRWLTRDEADRLVAACAPHLAPLVTFLLHTGARLGEALGLQWAQVDLQARRVAFLDTKNGTHRGVPLNDAAWLALANLPLRQGHVFLTPAGAPYYGSALGGSPIKTAFRGACRRAGIDGLRVHDLRHTFASWLVMSGAPLRTVAELLGHRSLAMVHRYSHLSPDHLRDAVDRLPSGAPRVQSRNGTE